MEDILTTLDDGSEAAAFCALLGQVVIDYEDSHRAEFGHWPRTPELRKNYIRSSRIGVVDPLHATLEQFAAERECFHNG